ncbi:unnamed protein product, partial [Polarella glacialis]
QSETSQGDSSLIRVMDLPSPYQQRASQQNVDAFMDRLVALACEALSWPHLPAWQRLEWAAALLLRVVPMKELPPWFLELHNLTRRDVGVDLISLDRACAVQCKCYDGSVPSIQIRHFLRVARWIFNASSCVLVTSNTSKITSSTLQQLRRYNADHQALTDEDIEKLSVSGPVTTKDEVSSELPPLRACQHACLQACEQGARIIEMACGSGKTRIMRELADRAKGKVLILVPSHILLDQFARLFPSFCRVGMGFNNNIDFCAPGFLSVYDSAHLLGNVSFAHIYLDEAHHPLPGGCPSADKLFQFSATHYLQPDFQFTTGQAIDDGILCDYDVIIPIVTEGDVQRCLAGMLAKRTGHFRRILAYCNSVEEARRFQKNLQDIGLAAWHINGESSCHERVDIPNADTCLFVEPRSSYVSIVQAIGRVL